MQHGLQISNIVQQPRHKTIQLFALAKEQLCCLHMLFLQCIGLPRKKVVPMIRYYWTRLIC